MERIDGLQSDALPRAAIKLSGAEHLALLSHCRPKALVVEYHLWRAMARADGFAELVCSNSFRSAALENAVGVIKEEMRRTGGALIRFADEARVPAGGALAVDRDNFADSVTRSLEAEPLLWALAALAPIRLLWGPLEDLLTAQTAAVAEHPTDED